MQPYVTFKTIDHSREPTGLTVQLPDITPTNFENYKNTLLPELETLLEGVSLLTFSNWDFVSESHVDVGTLPASPWAQRESRAIFECVDVALGRNFVIGVPCPDLTDMAQAGSDAINLANADVALYISTLASAARSPFGNTMAVIAGRITGVSN